MTQIRTLLLAAIATSILLPNALAFADEPPRRDDATVRIFFVNQWLPAPQPPQKEGTASGLSSSSPSMGGGFGGGSMQSLRFETVKIFLDGDFIGHAMFRHPDVLPTLNLEPGEHTFAFECEGYARHEQKLTVLSNGSTQWLVVTLKPPAKNSPKEPGLETKND